jgi:hypothetical protein
MNEHQSWTNAFGKHKMKNSSGIQEKWWNKEGNVKPTYFSVTNHYLFSKSFFLPYPNEFSITKWPTTTSEKKYSHAGKLSPLTSHLQ